MDDDISRIISKPLMVFDVLSNSNNPLISELMKNAHLPEGDFTFRIQLGHLSNEKEVPIHQLSVHVNSKFIETALIGPDGYFPNSVLGYHPFRRVCACSNNNQIDITNLEEEIIRLLPYARGEKKFPEEYPGSETEEEFENGPMDVVP